jgi:hypothetical protein
MVYSMGSAIHFLLSLQICILYLTCTPACTYDGKKTRFDWFILELLHWLSDEYLL